MLGTFLYPSLNLVSPNPVFIFIASVSASSNTISRPPIFRGATLPANPSLRGRQSPQRSYNGCLRNWQHLSKTYSEPASHEKAHRQWQLFNTHCRCPAKSFAIRTQSLRFPATWERCKLFIGNIVIILKLWVQFLFLCQYGCPLHQTDNVSPFRRIAFAYGDGPQGTYSWISVSAVAILGSV